MSVKIYVEGGFQGSTKSSCRMAFRLFFEKIIPQGSFSVIASGDRASAFKDFCLALGQNQGDFILLLVDSEEAVAGGPWQHLSAREGDRWRRPTGASDDQAHLMVQVMESWFLADQPALADYYDQGFLLGSLPGQPDIELIPKQRVFRVFNTPQGTQRKVPTTRRDTHSICSSVSIPVAYERPPVTPIASYWCWRGRRLAEHVC